MKGCYRKPFYAYQISYQNCIAKIFGKNVDNSLRKAYNKKATEGRALTVSLRSI